MAERVTQADLVTYDPLVDVVVMWCREGFGPPFDGGEDVRWSCRRRPLHDGPHACQASLDANWHPPADLHDLEEVRSWLTSS